MSVINLTPHSVMLYRPLEPIAEVAAATNLGETPGKVDFEAKHDDDGDYVVIPSSGSLRVTGPDPQEVGTWTVGPITVPVRTRRVYDGVEPKGLAVLMKFIDATRGQRRVVVVAGPVAENLHVIPMFADDAYEPELDLIHFFVPDTDPKAVVRDGEGRIKGVRAASAYH